MNEKKEKKEKEDRQTIKGTEKNVSCLPWLFSKQVPQALDHKQPEASGSVW